MSLLWKILGPRTRDSQQNSEKDQRRVRANKEQGGVLQSTYVMVQ